MNKEQLGLPYFLYMLIEALKRIGLKSQYRPITCIVLGGILNPFLDQSVFTGDIKIISASIFIGMFVGMGTTGIVAHNGKKE